MLDSTLLVLALLRPCGAAPADLAAPAPVAAPQPPQQDPRLSRPAPPSEAEVVRLRNEIESIFDVAKRSKAKDEARQLAAELLGEAQHGQGNSPAQRYVLLTLALEVAEKVGDVAVVRGAIDGLDQHYLVDGPILKYESAARMTGNGQTGCPPIDLVRLFVDAGLGCVSMSPAKAKRALEDAEVQAQRCYGTAEVYAEALKAVAALKEGIQKAKLDAERLPAAARVPVPPEHDADRVKTRAALKTLHKDLDKRPRRDVDAARSKALEEGMATRKHGPGARYEYLVAAVALAAQAGDTVALRRAVEELGTQFEVDAGKQKLQAARDAVRWKTAKAEDLMRLLLECARSLMAQDGALARQALVEAEAQRERHRFSTELYKVLGEECRAVRAEIEDAAALAELRAAVAANPADAKAAERLGWYLCVRRESWSEGLPLLAQGTMQLVPGVLASAIAKKELAATVSDDLAWEIAEAWWAFADSAASDAADKPALRRHARDWYRKLEHVKDLRRHKIESCLREEAPPPKAEPEPPAKVEPPVPPKPAKPEAPRDAAIAGAIGEGLAWLAKHQDADGHWDCDRFMKHDPADAASDGPGNAVHDVGVTGLAALAFVGGGHVGAGEFDGVVQRALDWLEKQQDPATGLIGTASSHDFVYSHAIATLALARAAKVADEPRWAQCAQAGVVYLLRHRNPGRAWRYRPQDGDNDLCVTSWCLAACVAAQDVGCEVDDKVLREVGRFLDDLTDPTGKHGYTNPGEASSRKPGDHARRFPVEKSEAMTAAGLYCRHLLRDKRLDVLSRAAALIAARSPVWDPPGGTIDLYYWYYGTLALRRAGGEAWTAWQRALREALLPNQRRDGASRGSWDPIDAWGEDGGRVATTAFACLALQGGFSR